MICLLPARFGSFFSDFALLSGNCSAGTQAWGDPKPQAIEPGQYFAFFHVIHVDAPRELGMTVENRLTRALMCWVLRENSVGTMVYNFTCANFKGRQGRLYWQIICPFRDGLIEGLLLLLSRRALT